MAKQPLGGMVTGVILRISILRAKNKEAALLRTWKHAGAIVQSTQERAFSCAGRSVGADHRWVCVTVTAYFIRKAALKTPKSRDGFNSLVGVLKIPLNFCPKLPKGAVRWRFWLKVNGCVGRGSKQLNFSLFTHPSNHYHGHPGLRPAYGTALHCQPCAVPS